MVRAAKSSASKQTTTPATVAPVENVVVQATASSEKKTKKAKTNQIITVFKKEVFKNLIKIKIILEINIPAIS